MLLRDMEDYDDVVRKVLGWFTAEQLLNIVPMETLLPLVPPEQRLAGIPPEQRLAGLDTEQAVLALPDDALRRFPQEFFATLSEHARDAIRRRIGR